MDASPSPYAAAWKARFQRAREENEQRRQGALIAAARCGCILREQFGAQRIIVFGSAVRPGRFGAESDLDLAVEGLDGIHLLRAEAECRRIARMEVQLVDMGQVSSQMRDRIREEGVVLA